MAGKKGDMDFKITADPMKAVQGLAKVVAKQEDVIAKLKQSNREARKGGKEMKDMGGAAQNSMGKILGMVGAFGGLTGVLGTLRQVFAEMKKTDELQTKMYGTALSMEQRSLKVMQMRGDLSAGGRAAVMKDIEDVAKKATVSLEVAAQILFFAESTITSSLAEAKSAAIEIGKFAAPAGLTSQDVPTLARLFKAVGADTPEKQRRVLGQVYVATSKSVAEVGPFLQAFAKPMTVGIERGFTLPQMLGLMSAAIESTGTVSEAGTIAASGLDVILGRSSTAFDYFEKYAKKKGIDYSALSTMERFEFTRNLYEEAKRGGTKAEKEMIKAFGGESVRYLRQLFSEQGQRQYQLVTTGATAATGAKIGQMYEAYTGLSTAGETRRTTRAELADTEFGEKREPRVVLRDLTEKIWNQVHARLVGGGEYITMGLTSEAGERKMVQDMILSQNLALSYELTKEGSPERAEAVRLYRQFMTKPFFAREPALMKEAFEATRGFDLIGEEGRLGDPKKLLSEIYGPGARIGTYGAPEMYLRGLRGFYKIKGEADKATQGLLEKILTELETMNSNISSTIPVAMPSED